MLTTQQAAYGLGQMSMRGDSDFNLQTERDYSIAVPPALSCIGLQNQSMVNDVAMNVPTSFDCRGRDGDQ